MKKIKCKVCKTKFLGTKETLYLAIEKLSALTALTAPVKTFECFDCPKCGCQNAVNVRMAAIKCDERCDADGE